MMQLTNLHNEVLLILVRLLSNHSLINFSLVCRDFFQLARSEVKHRKYTKLYGCLQLALSCHRSPKWHHSIEVLYNIRHDRSIVKYIKEIEYAPPYAHIPSNAPVEFEGNPLTEDHKAKLKECNYFEDEVDSLTFLTEKENREWKKAAREGGHNICFVLLMSLCAHATKLSLDSLENLPVYLDRVIDHLNDEYKSHSASKHRGIASYEEGQLFPRLTSLVLSGKDDELGMGFEADYSVLEIPTLSKLHLFMIGRAENVDDWIWSCGPGRSCSVREVSASFCSFNPEALANFVRGLPLLEHFKYFDRFNFETGNDYLEWGSLEQFIEFFRNHAKDFLGKRSLEAFVNEEQELEIKKLPLTVSESDQY